MATVRRFVVVPAIPEKLKSLTELANNLWTLWNYEATALFQRLDPDLWESTNHNPVRLLSLINQEKLQVASEDEGFLAHLTKITNDLHHYMRQPTWFSQHYPNSTARIAYFSAEYGLHESLPIYSGGLGVLSGDHLKSASDLGLPLVAVGMLYRFGYFRQSLNAEGWQQEHYPENDFFTLPITQVVNATTHVPLTVQIELPTGPVKAFIWRVQVGRVSLFLMDTNVPENRPEDRGITERLYGGDQDMRVRQEVLLGIGGIRALAAMGIKPTVCHMNEGHSAFLSLERINTLMQEDKLTFPQAFELASSSNVFTTHTPVPAGNDAFPIDMVNHYLAPYYAKLGLSQAEFCRLGRINPYNEHEPFGMTVLALRTAWRCNGVSALHGKVSRDMWRHIWPELPVTEVPITSITNGVHTQTWLSDEFAGLYTRYLGANWGDRPADHSVWSRVDKIPDGELWRSHERRRERLIGFVRERLRRQIERRGASVGEIQRIDEILDPEALTIGFARRFATYKRATLLMRNAERLTKMLTDRDRPVQFVFAGKSHPRDDGGKRYIQEVINFCRREEIRIRMVFIEDYDMNVARYLIQGVDVWLNTPRRPLEASGTSGMKGPVNGGINLSILDGWWDEAYNHENGWAIGNTQEMSNEAYQDECDSLSLFELLEKEVVPMFYDRGPDGLPRRWIQRMKNSIRTVGSYFNTNRMVQQYLELFYLPANQSYFKLGADQAGEAAELARWKTGLHKNWSQVRVRGIEAPTSEPLMAGAKLKIFAEVELGAISPDEVNVELYHGLLDADGEIQQAHRTPMTRTGGQETGVHRYSGSIAAQNCGQQGFAVRVLPKNAKVDVRVEPNLIRWG